MTSLVPGAVVKSENHNPKLWLEEHMFSFFSPFKILVLLHKTDIINVCCEPHRYGAIQGWWYLWLAGCCAFLSRWWSYAHPSVQGRAVPTQGWAFAAPATRGFIYTLIRPPGKNIVPRPCAHPALGGCSWLLWHCPETRKGHVVAAWALIVPGCSCEAKSGSGSKLTGMLMPVRPKSQRLLIIIMLVWGKEAKTKLNKTWHNL